MKKRYLLFLILFGFNYLMWGQCVNPGCSGTNLLNISTGVDQAGNLLPVGNADPNWQLMNFPPLDPANLASGCAPPIVTIPNANIIGPHITALNNCPWLNINNCPCPNNSSPCGILSANTTKFMGCNNLSSTQPWRFRRYFCVCQPSTIAISGNIRIDDRGSFGVFDINDNPLLTTVIPSNSFNSNTNINPTNQTLNLNTGTYYIEVDVINTNQGLMGFNVSGSLTDVNGQSSLINSNTSCCANTANLTVQKVIETINCNGILESGESPGTGWNFTLMNANNSPIQSQTTNNFGELTFSGLSPGSYSVVEQVQPGFVTSNSTQQVTINNNGGTSITFFNCPQSNMPVPDCCTLDLNLERTNTGLSVGSNSVIYSTEFELTTSGAPIQEIRASVVDLEFDYEPADCQSCEDDLRNWGKLFPTSSIGGLSIEQQSYWQGNNEISAYLGSRDAIWEAIWSGRPTDFRNGQKFTISSLLPYPKDLDCCENEVKFCLNLSVKDVNCNYCDTMVCCNVMYNKNGLINDCYACNDPIEINIQEEWDGCCRKKLTAIGATGLGVQWSNGSTNRIITVTSSGTYTVSASKQCKGQTITGSSTVSVYMPEGNFPKLVAPKALAPNSSIPENRIMRISHIGPALGASPAYNARKWKLYIFNRWDTGANSGAIYVDEEEIEDNQCNGFVNGEITWDGRDGNGQLVPQGVYPYLLELTNCDGTDDTHEYQDWECAEWGNLIFPPWKKYCKRYHQVYHNRRIGHVSVIY